MANFNTHLLYGSVVTGFVSSFCYTTEVLTLQETLLVWATGTVASILPDIDHDNSHATRMLYNVLAVALMGVAMYYLAPRISFIEVWVVLVTIYIAVRFPIKMIFSKFTKHRGIFHSFLATLFFGLLVASVSYGILKQEALLSWFLGIMTMIGYGTHLILDEVFAVDLANTKLKRSFGTAAKLFSVQNFPTTIIMFGLTLVLLFTVPPIDTTWESVSNHWHPDTLMANLEPFYPGWINPDWFDNDIFKQEWMDPQWILSQLEDREWPQVQSPVKFSE